MISDRIRIGSEVVTDYIDENDMKMVLHDADIRDDLCMYMESRYGKVRFFDELTMGKSRADIVMVTGQGLIGVEIKSDADTYERLSRQVKDYDRFFGEGSLLHYKRRTDYINTLARARCM